MPALTITGNTNDALAAIARLEKQYDQLEQKIKHAGAASKSAGDDGRTAFDAWAQGAMRAQSQITGITSSLDAVRTAIKMVSVEWEDMKNRQEKAANANIAFAKNLTRLALATDTPLGEIRQQMMTMSANANVNLADIPEMMNRMQASKGPTQTMGDVERMFYAAARIGKFDPESMGMLGETGLDITKQVPGTTPEQALGFSLAAQAMSRVADPMQFNQNVIPAVLGANKIAGTPLEVGVGVSNALTQGAGDRTGRRSATAQIALEMQLKEAFPEMSGTAERIDYLQNNPQARESFLSGLKNQVVGPDGQTLDLNLEPYAGERRMRPAIEALLTKGTAEANIYEETRRSLIPLGRADEEYQRRARDMGADETMRVAEREQQLRGATERQRIGDAKGARASVERKGFEEVLEAANTGFFDRQFLGMRRFFREQFLGQSPEDATRNTLEEYARGEESFRPEGRIAGSIREAMVQNEADLEAAGKTVALRQREAARSGDSALAESLARQEKILYEQLQELRKSKQRPINLNSGNNREE